jgi:hypothetical protein
MWREARLHTVANGDENSGKVVLLKAVLVQVDGGTAQLTLNVALVRSQCSASSPGRLISRQTAQIAPDHGVKILRKTSFLTCLPLQPHHVVSTTSTSTTTSNTNINATNITSPTTQIMMIIIIIIISS